MTIASRKNISAILCSATNAKTRPLGCNGPLDQPGPKRSQPIWNE